MSARIRASVSSDVRRRRVSRARGAARPPGFTRYVRCGPNGRHEIHSDAPFGLQVWGWGTPLTTTFSQDVSYGYPGGMNVAPINDVVIQ